MTQEDIIQMTLRDSNYHLSLFSKEEIDARRKKIIVKESKGKKTPFVTCIVRDKDIQLKPEEIVRQLYAARLMGQYGYPTYALGRGLPQRKRRSGRPGPGERHAHYGIGLHQ